MIRRGRQIKILCKGGEIVRKTTMLLALFLVLGIFLVACGSKDETVSKEEEQEENIVKEEQVVDLFGKAEKVKEFSYDFVMTSGEEVTKGTNWTKDNLFKIQFNFDEEEMIYLLDTDEMISYTYLPSKKIAIKNKVENLEKQSIRKPHDYIKGMDNEKTKIVETTTYDKQECVVLSEVNDEGTEILRMWFSTKHNLPIKVESNLDSEEKMVMEYKKIKIEKVPENIFELPEDVAVTDQTK